MKKLGLIDKMVFVLNVLAATLLFLSYVLPYLPPKAFSVLSVLSLGVVILILVNFLFCIYWLFRLKRYILVSASVLLIGYVFYGSLYKFSSPKNIDGPNNFKVMNYNVRLFNLFEWIPNTSVETKIVELVKNEKPDILSIQDYHPLKNSQLSFFKYKYEYLSGKKIKHGQAIFSQFPIINSGSVGFPNSSNNAIFADVVKGKDTIRIYNVHLESLRINTQIDSLKKEKSELIFNRVSKTFKMQQSQTELLLAHKAKSHYKTIICGDFNNTAFSYVYRQISKDLNDSYKEAGYGFGRTYDFKFFPIRIDFILADEAFTVNGFKSFNERYSDHYPIMSTLSLEE